MFPRGACYNKREMDLWKRGSVRMMEQRPVGVIGAMEVEVDAVLAAMEEKVEQAYAGMGFTRGTLSGAPVVVAQCSAGKVNAALCAQAMVDLFRPRLVLNIGVAGGVGPDVHIGDVVVATACVQYDFDTTALDPWPVGQLLLPGVEEPQRFLPCDQRVGDLLAQAGEKLYGRVHRGVVATGDRFVADPQFGLWLHKEFGALACEMEGAAIAQVCLVNQVPCGVLRAISDNALDSETVDFVTFAASSAQKAQELLRQVAEPMSGA